MATSEILLIEPIDGLGSEGDQVVVKAGYARNFLLPQKKAVPVTRANRKQIEALQARRAQREAKNLEGAKFLAEKVAGTTFAIAVKTGDSGKMFGAVTAANVFKKIQEAGLGIEKKLVHLEAPIKELGKHTISIKLHAEVEAELSFDVVSENPIKEEAEEASEAE